MVKMQSSKQTLVVIFFAFIFAAACNTNKNNSKIPSDYIYRRFILQDSLALIEIYVPNELDTFFQWVHINDNVCDDYRKYRFANKYFSPLAETGFFYDSPDSSYDFTVYHVDKYRCKEKRSNHFDSTDLARKMSFIKLKHADNGDSINDLSGEIADYNGSEFLVIAYTSVQSYPVEFRAQYLQGATMIDSNIVMFNYYTNASHQSNFIERMKFSLATVKVTRLKYNTPL